MNSIVSARNLRKVFRVGFLARKVHAVRDVSFDVQRGEIFGLLGPNGAGKTTSIKMLLGFVRPSGGEATVAGHPAGSHAARRKLGYLPENPALYEFLTGEEYLKWSARLSGLSSPEAKARATRLLHDVGLAGRADRAIRRFSKGMVQRLALAQAMVGDPDLLILDEPMSGLDPIGRKDVRDLIFRLREEGKTVIFSTHILSDVEAICDRVAIMIDGSITDCGTLSALLDPGVRAVEVVARGVPAPLEERFRTEGARTIQRDGASVFAFGSEDAAQAALREIVSAGARVVTVQAHRQTLEQLFVTRAAARQAGGPG